MPRIGVKLQIHLMNVSVEISPLVGFSLNLDDVRTGPERAYVRVIKDISTKLVSSYYLSTCFYKNRQGLTCSLGLFADQKD